MLDGARCGALNVLPSHDFSPLPTKSMWTLHTVDWMNETCKNWWAKERKGNSMVLFSGGELAMRLHCTNFMLTFTQFGFYRDSLALSLLCVFAHSLCCFGTWFKYCGYGIQKVFIYCVDSLRKSLVHHSHWFEQFVCASWQNERSTVNLFFCTEFPLKERISCRTHVEIYE